MTGKRSVVYGTSGLNVSTTLEEAAASALVAGFLKMQGDLS